MTTFNDLRLNAFLSGYIEAMLFAETATDLNGEDIEDLSGYELNAAALDSSKQVCALFLDWHGEKVDLAISGSDDYNHTKAGRDLWFTRQGHGVGFWDRGLGTVGKDLSEAAWDFGEVDVFIDNDGLVGVSSETGHGGPTVHI